jgi:hypothetical protein
MPDMASDWARHYHLCIVYIRTEDLDALRSAMEQRQHLRAADIAFLHEHDFDSIHLSGVPEEIQMFAVLVIHAVFVDLAEAFQMLDGALSIEHLLIDKLCDFLSICCEAHGRSDLLPTLQLLTQSQESVEQVLII